MFVYWFRAFFNGLSANFLHFTETTDGRSHRGGSGRRVHPGTAGDDALTPFAGPDTDTGAFHGVLKTKDNC